MCRLTYTTSIFLKLHLSLQQINNCARVLIRIKAKPHY